MKKLLMLIVAGGLAVLVAVAVAAVSSGSARAGKPSALAKLAQARVDAAAAAFAAAETQWKAGRGSVELVCGWSARWFEAQRDQPLKGKALAAAADDHLARVQAIETETARLVDAGQVPSSDKLMAAYFRAEAEHWAGRAHGVK